VYIGTTSITSLTAAFTNGLMETIRAETFGEPNQF